MEIVVRVEGVMSPARAAAARNHVLEQMAPLGATDVIWIFHMAGYPSSATSAARAR